MEGKKIMSIEDARNRQKEKNDFKNSLKVHEDDNKGNWKIMTVMEARNRERAKKGELRENKQELEKEMIARMKQLRKEYTEEQDVLGIFTSEFEHRYIGDIEAYAKKLLDDLKKGNESR